MNPLTLVKRIQKINSQEASLGISDDASWHAKYKDSAYVFVGGIPYDLTEGDLLAVFAQYGEIVDVNLVRDKGTGKSKGFAFVAYEDQRSTTLAVDNLNGAQILGRIIRVDHVTKYKKKEEEDEETERKNREARGVCRAFQRGECTRGAGCKFSHDEQRAANTGWGAKDDASAKWGHDKFDKPKDRDREFKLREDHGRKDEKRFRRHDLDDNPEPKSGDDHYKRGEKLSKRNHDDSGEGEKRLRRHDDNEETKLRDNHYKKEEKRSRRNDEDEVPQHSRRDNNRREEDRSKRHGDEEYRPKLREDDNRGERDITVRHRSESYRKENQDENRNFLTSHGRDSSSHSHRERHEDRHREKNEYRRR